MSTYLDKLLEDYNRRIRVSNNYKLLASGKLYSKEEKEEEDIENIEEIFEQIADIADQLKKELPKLQGSVSNSAKEALKLTQEIENAYRTALKVRHLSRNRIVSPVVYRKIMSYYGRHKNRRYYSKYKIDSEIHSFIMKLGRYLESLDNKRGIKINRDSDLVYHYYAIPSIVAMYSVGINNVLGYLSSAVTHAAHIMELAMHALVEFSPKIMKAIPILPNVLPTFLAAFLIAFLTGALLTIIGYALHPERGTKFKMLLDKIKINIGMRKSYIHAAYVIYVYKLYDILSAMSSYIIMVGELTKKGKEVNAEKSAKKLEEKAKKSAHIVGLKDKLLAVLKDKLNIDLFEVSKNKIKALDDSFRVDLERYKELIDSVKKNKEDKNLNILNYKFAVSSEAMKKLFEYYGDKFQGSGEWIEVTVEYTGGSYHKAANPLKKIEISGFSGDTKEAANFIGAVLALADKLVVDRIGEQEFESPIILVDLQKLKMLAYKSKPLIDKLAGAVTGLINKITGLIKKEARKEKLDPTTLSNLMFEAYLIITKVKEKETRSEKEPDNKEEEKEKEEKIDDKKIEEEE